MIPEQSTEEKHRSKFKLAVGPCLFSTLFFFNWKSAFLSAFNTISIILCSKTFPTLYPNVSIYYSFLADNLPLYLWIESMHNDLLPWNVRRLKMTVRYIRDTQQEANNLCVPIPSFWILSQNFLIKITLFYSNQLTRHFHSPYNKQCKDLAQLHEYLNSSVSTESILFWFYGNNKNKF